jgi:hypothetical protein
MVDGEPASEPRAREAGSMSSLAARPIRGQTSLRVEDFNSAWLALPQMRWMLFWFLSSAVLVPLLVLSNSSEPPAPGALLLIPLMLAGLGYGIIKGRTRWAQAVLKASGGEAVEYLFDEYGFQVQMPGREARAEWASLHRHAETDEAFLIYSTPQLMNLVPKRAFAATDQARLRAELAARIPRAKQGGGARKLILVGVIAVVALLALWQFLVP